MDNVVNFPVKSKKQPQPKERPSEVEKSEDVKSNLALEAAYKSLKNNFEANTVDGFIGLLKNKDGELVIYNVGFTSIESIGLTEIIKDAIKLDLGSLFDDTVEYADEDA